MADLSTNIPQISFGQADKETAVNELFDAASPSMLFGRNGVTSAGLNFGIFGGRWNGVAVANKVLALTDNSTLYISASLSTGDATFQTGSFKTGEMPLYKVTTSGGLVTAYEDRRAAYGIGIPEAPTDGKQYARKDAGWAEVATSYGDMESATYDPQGIEADAFDRANHTGTQPMESIGNKQCKVLDDLNELVDFSDLDATLTPGGYIVKNSVGNSFASNALLIVAENGGFTTQVLAAPYLGKLGMRVYDGTSWGSLQFSLATVDITNWYVATTASAANAVINADGTFSRSLFVPAPLAPKITSGLTAQADTDVLRPGPLTAATTFPNPTGTPMDGFGFVIELIDDGTARALTWGSDYAAGFAALPTTTTAGKLGQVAIQYRDGKYRCDGVRWMA